jgi:dihydrofolate reductase
MSPTQVFIIVAISTDGFIAQSAHQPSVDWTSPEDKRLFHQRTKQAGVVVMGETTFATINSRYLPLSERLNVIYSYKSRDELATQMGIGVEKVSDQSLQVTSLPPQQLVAQLQQAGFMEVAICGGSSIYSQFLQSGVVNKLFITVEPVIFGDGIKLFNQPMQQQLKLIASTRLNEKGSILLEYECQ